MEAIAKQDSKVTEEEYDTLPEALEFSEQSKFKSMATYQLNKDDFPDYDTYVVRPGDSLAKISFMFDISIQRLKKINDLHSDDIFTG